MLVLRREAPQESGGCGHKENYITESSLLFSPLRCILKTHVTSSFLSDDLEVIKQGGESLSSSAVMSEAILVLSELERDAANNTSSQE